MSSPWTPLLQGFPEAATSDGLWLGNDHALPEDASIVVPLQSQALLSVTGPEAGKFLQGQTTTDFRDVSDNRSRPGCYLNLKGRVIASFRAVQQGERIDLLMDATLAAVMKERLGKFIVFSKAVLALDASRLPLGLCGPAAEAALLACKLPVPAETHAVTHQDGISIVRLHGQHRFLLLCPQETLAARWEALTQQLAPAGENLWRLHQIEAGETQVLTAGSELFQPQELNFQLLDGVSYHKGCYTGQEIVARLYFRGKLKQHAQRYAVATTETPAPGAPLVHEGKTVGDVVLAARRHTGTIECLAIARPEHNGNLLLGENGPPLELLPLPYDVPAQD